MIIFEGLAALNQHASTDAVSYLIRGSMGVFFASSGYHKLFVPEVREKFCNLFKKLGCYNPFTIWAVPAGELAGGVGLITGTLVLPAAVGLVFILMAAICLDCWNEVVEKKPRDPADWVAKTFYMPEALMVILLSILVFVGPGTLSVDSVLNSLF